MKIIQLIRQYLLDTYGVEGKLPTGFGAHKISKADRATINDITGTSFKLSATWEDVITSAAQQETSTLAVLTGVSLGAILKEYQDSLDVNTEEEVWKNEHFGATYEDMVNKYSFELFIAIMTWAKSFLYTGRDTHDKLDKAMKTWQKKLDDLEANQKNLILAKMVHEYGQDKYSAFEFIANPDAEELCLAINHVIFPIDQIQDVFPVHQHCRCHVRLIERV